MDSTLKVIHNQLAEIMKLLRQQSNNFQASGTTELTFTEKYGLTLPCETLEQIEALNEALRNDERCQEQFSNFLQFGVNKTARIGKSTTRMMKQCLSRELAMKLTAQKQIPGKTLLKGMPFCSILENTLRIIYKDITKSNSIIKAIGDVLSNAKDWDGFRKKREKKANNEQTNNDE